MGRPDRPHSPSVDLYYEGSLVTRGRIDLRELPGVTVWSEDPLGFVNCVDWATFGIEEEEPDQLPPDPEVCRWIHGTRYAYYKQSCRCGICADHHGNFRSDRLPTLEPDDPRHGTNSAYVGHRCRCGPCVAAAVEYRAARRARLRSERLDGPTTDLLRSEP